MAALVFQELAWHEGEKAMHDLMHTPSDYDNPTVPYLSPGAATLLERSPLLALGTLDDQGRPWTTLLGGERGFSRGLQGSYMAFKIAADSKYDPVVTSVLGKPEQMQDGISKIPKMLGGLAIDLENRKRVKLYGKTVMGALREVETEDEGNPTSTQIQLVAHIEQSLGNCPKYLNAKHIVPHHSKPELVFEGQSTLCDASIQHIQQSDLFFISSSNSGKDMDTNHRGGPAGFVRVLDNDPKVGTRIVWPEYSGNRLYQTLGNLFTTPLAGLVFPNFENGDVLYVTGTTEIVAGAKAAEVLPKSNLAVILTVTSARYVRDGLFYRGKPLKPSPYNPAVWKTSKEAKAQGTAAPTTETLAKAMLVSREKITPTVARFHFAFPNEVKADYQEGQWVALDLSSELYSGYSHMRDADPLSLNDDFVRTFTVSSHPSSVRPNEFTITIRNVGRVTGFLFDLREGRVGSIDIGVRGFGGEFKIQGGTKEEPVGFLAGGIGITPLLSAAKDLLAEQIKILWTLGVHDLPLASHIIKEASHLAPSVKLFVTGLGSVVLPAVEDQLNELKDLGVAVEQRRLVYGDLEEFEDISKWYLCTSPALRKILLGWLPDKEVLYEDFSY